MLYIPIATNPDKAEFPRIVAPPLSSGTGRGRRRPLSGQTRTCFLALFSGAASGEQPHPGARVWPSMALLSELL